MTHRHIVRIALALLMAVLMVTLPASAQKRGRKKPQPKKPIEVEVVPVPMPDDVEIPPETEPREMSPLAKAFASELAGAGLDFWSSRLNVYKTRIDRALNPCDLAELNRMRVFWSMFVETKAWESLLYNGNRLFGTGGGESPTGETPEESVSSIDQTVDRISEVLETIFVARSIARRYKPEMASLKNEMMTDLSSFADTIMQVKEAFGSAHRAEIEADPDAREGFGKINREEMDQMIAGLRQDDELAVVAGLMIEPIVMLYNGQDFRRILTELDVLPSELKGIIVGTNSILGQSRPNPASSTVAIDYQLAEPTSGTVLKIFDVEGNMIGSYDQGARPTGSHTAEIDVAALPNGTYLYQLTVATAQGERVYSRTMQVQR